MILKAPKYIQFFPSFRCNQDCTFCFNRDVSPVAEMTSDRIPDFLTILSNAGIHELDILGGEPTLYPNLFDIIDIAKQGDIKVFLSTNGSNTVMLEELSKRYADKERFRLGISINNDEISPELYNFILKYKPVLKGVVSTERVIPEAAASILQNHDMKYYLLFMDTISMPDLATCLSFPEYLRVLQNLKKRFKNIEGVYCSGFINSDTDSPVLQRIRCPAGTTKLSVMPDGSVYPCYLFFRHQDYKLGNIFQDNFSKIWGSPVLEFFRRFEGNKCPLKKCELFERCHGGCPAISLLLCNDIEAPEPRCFQLKANDGLFSL